MRMVLRVVLALCVVVGLVSTGVAMGNGALPDGDDAIMVSPGTIVLDKVSDVTVHTNIAAAIVVSGTVTLNGVVPTGVWADDCGDLVARFAIEDLGLVPGEVALTLGCARTDGGAFSATDVVRAK